MSSVSHVQRPSRRSIKFNMAGQTWQPCRVQRRAPGPIAVVSVGALAACDWGHFHCLSRLAEVPVAHLFVLGGVSSGNTLEHESKPSHSYSPSSDPCVRLHKPPRTGRCHSSSHISKNRTEAGKRGDPCRNNAFPPLHSLALRHWLSRSKTIILCDQGLQAHF